MKKTNGSSNGILMGSNNQKKSFLYAARGPNNDDVERDIPWIPNPTKSTVSQIYHYNNTVNDETKSNIVISMSNNNHMGSNNNNNYNNYNDEPSRGYLSDPIIHDGSSNGHRRRPTARQRSDDAIDSNYNGSSSKPHYRNTTQYQHQLRSYINPNNDRSSYVATNGPSSRRRGPLGSTNGRNQKPWSLYHVVVLCMSTWCVISLFLYRKLTSSSNLENPTMVGRFLLYWKHGSSLLDEDSRNTIAVQKFAQSIQFFHNVTITNIVPPLTEHIRQQFQSRVTQQQELPQVDCNKLGSVIDLSKIRSSLPFTNDEGGVWKQGFELHPIFNVSSTQDTLEDGDNTKIEIIVVPHSHVDPYLVKVLDNYDSNHFVDEHVDRIMDHVLESLNKSETRTFVWSEIHALERYYRQASKEDRALLLDVIQRKQFEIVNGGWVGTPDEAVTNIRNIEISLQEGIRWLNGTFNITPKYVWSIGPSGYSSKVTKLYADYGYRGMVIQHVHYAVKKYFAQNKLLEFNWILPSESKSNTNKLDQLTIAQRILHPTCEKQSMVTHVMPFYTYDIPHTCGPDPKICCQFDFELLEEKKATPKLKNSKMCPWGTEPVIVTDENVQERALLLLDQYLKKASLFQFNTVLVPLGGDLKFIFNSEVPYSNYERIFEYINTNIPKVKIRFGTISQYFEALAKNQLKQKGKNEENVLEVPNIMGSFLPFADRDSEYATNYFSQSSISRSTIARLQRMIYAAETMGANTSDLEQVRRLLSIYSHHDIVRSSATRNRDVITDFEHTITDASDAMAKLIVDRFISQLETKYSSLTSIFDTTTIKAINQTMEYCGSSSDLIYGEPNSEFRCAHKIKHDVIVYNPSSTRKQAMCKDIEIEPNQFVKVQLPCVDRNKKTELRDSNIDLTLKLNESTGLLVGPIREEWKTVSIEKGAGKGNWIQRECIDYKFKSKTNFTLKANTDGQYILRGPSRTRTAIEHDAVFIAETGTVAKVIDFYYQLASVVSNSNGFAVRFGLPQLKTGRLIYADTNENRAEVYQFRSDLPFQSQVVPMSTMAYIQDNYTRITLVSEHGHGVMSAVDGYIDIFLNRAMINKDVRVKNIPTRLRLVLEQRDPTRSRPFTSTSVISTYTREMWDEVQHPLEIFGTRVAYPPSSSYAKRMNMRHKKIYAPPIKSEPINVTKYNFTNTFVPFVFMVHKRVNYLQEAIESLRNSDFPKKDVPIIISHDGHVPEMMEYVNSLKNEFKVIQLFHPYACYDHKDTFPGGNDTALNIGYRGDSYGHKREAGVTCCKHHFTWILQQVFSLDMQQLHGANTKSIPSDEDTFFFTEEDYVLGPTIYSSIISGFNAMEKYKDQVNGGSGFFGVTFEPKLSTYKYHKDSWYAFSFKSGPMTINRAIFSKIQKNADQYCRFDDYNWDWSIVNLQTKDLIPSTVLAPTDYLVKHIGMEGGMHSEYNKKKFKNQKIFVSSNFRGGTFVGSPRIGYVKPRGGYGGWGHPADQDHCMKILSSG